MRRPFANPQTRRALLLGAGGAGLLLALPAAAHHGWSRFGDGRFELTGRVETVYLGNPHGELAVRVDDGPDAGLWEVGLGPPFRNRRAGIEEGTVAVGDEVTAIGKRHRDPAVLAMKTERLIVGGESHDIYPERLRGA